MVDITPTPRVLRQLGQIPFLPWQCLAEFIDNSIDGFLRAQKEGISLSERKIVVSWPKANTSDPQLEIVDTGPGMVLEQLTKCVRAGYSGNDYINNLGLFGMGFNISTARMGDSTLFLSATQEASEWAGVTIDFSALVKQGTFEAPECTEPKHKPSEHGTKIIISKLDPGLFQQLKSNAPATRRLLEDIYSPILEDMGLQILVQGKILAPRPHCVWNQERSVVHKRQNVPALIEIDETLDNALFDTLRNRYLSADEEDDAMVSKSQGNELPEGVVERQKRIHGWIGIQRYSDPTDFGIDFVRNGRKILLRDKSMFQFKNPVTLNSETQYPIELASTMGGRIVGQIHIDHIPPTYQKNEFHRTDPSWQELIAVLLGDGPILPGTRSNMGYDGDNTSPIGRLVNAYRRGDAGTKRLAAPSTVAHKFKEKFFKGDPEYQSDEKWYLAAKEMDRKRADKESSAATDVDAGDSPTDDIHSYLDGSGDASAGPGPIAIPDPKPDLVEDMRSRSTKVESLSREYTYGGCTSPYIVSVYEVKKGTIGDSTSGLPCKFVPSGNEIEFFFDPEHKFLTHYPTLPADLLLLYLAERFKIRDNIPGRDIAELFSDLMQTNYQERQLDLASLQGKAREIFDHLRQYIVSELKIREAEIVDCIHESSGDVEETAAAISSHPELLKKFQSRGIGALASIQSVPFRTLIRVVEQFPEEFFDGKFFHRLYGSITLPDKKASERLQSQAKDNIASLLKDLESVLSDIMATKSAQDIKETLQRISHSIVMLNGELIE